MDHKETIRRLVDTKSIVYVGASSSPEKMSGMGIRNIYKSGYQGDIYAVNIRGEVIDGHPTLRSISELPYGVETAFITLPAKHCAKSVRELGEKGVLTAVVAVGGFSELGSEEGRRLEADLRLAAKETGIRIVGPVCNGLYSTHNHLAVGYNAVHGRVLSSGSVGLVSHSGALLAPLVYAIENSGAGLSRFFSCGSEIDLCMADYMDYLVEDDQTKVIALIVDSIGDGERFRNVLRRARSAGKPVVALKLGDSVEGKAAAMAHSSHLAGAKEVYEAVFREEGVMKVPTLESLAITAAILASGRRPKTNTVTACCPSGGGGIMLVDRMTENGVKFCALAPETLDVINHHLVFDSATVLNPFDLGLGGRSNYRVNVGALADDPGTGVLICYVTPVQTASKRVEMAKAFTDVAKDHPEVPVIILFPGLVEDDEMAVYREAKLPVVSSVLETVAVTKALLSVSAAQKADVVPEAEASEKVKAILGENQAGSLSEHSSKELLREFGVHTSREVLVRELDEGIKAAQAIGYPVVLKACGRKLTHKSEYQLVKVNIENEDQLRKKWAQLQENLKKLPSAPVEGILVAEMMKGGIEVIFGVTKDPEFGHIAVLGPGGVLAEMMGNGAMARHSLPLSRDSIKEMIAQTPLKKRLDGYRGEESCDTEALVEEIYKISAGIYCMKDRIEAMDANPVLVKKRGCGAAVLDALLILG